MPPSLKKPSRKNKVVKLSAYPKKKPTPRNLNVNQPSSLLATGAKTPSLLPATALLKGSSIIDRRNGSKSSFTSSALTRVALPPPLLTPFPMYAEYTLQQLPSLVLRLAHDLWVNLTAEQLSKKSWMHDAIAFQQKVPLGCVTKNMAMGVLGNVDATGVERMLAKLGEDEYVIGDSLDPDKPLRVSAKGPVLWTISVDAQDVKEVVILGSTFFQKLDILCGDRSPFDVTRLDTQEALEQFVKQKETLDITPAQFGQVDSPKEWNQEIFNSILKVNDIAVDEDEEDNAQIDPTIVYRLFREFLINYAPGMRVITHGDFLDYENEWVEEKLKLSGVEDVHYNLTKSLLWKYHNLLVNTGYLTLYSVTLHNASAQLGSTANSHTPLKNHLKGSFSDMGGANDDDDDIDPSVISGGIHINNHHTDEDNKDTSFKNDPPLRVSIPNLGNLLGVLRHTRRWVLDTIISGGVHTNLGSTGKSGTVGITKRAPTKGLGNGSRQLMEGTLRDKWTNKKESSLYRKFKGISLDAVLLDAYGGGWIEPFDTPVGICWRYTGKALTV